MIKVKEYKKVYALLLIVTVALLFGQDALGAITYSNSFSVSDGDPMRIATDRQGNIYVSSIQTMTNTRVWKFSSNGNLLGYVNGFIGRPTGLAVDRANKVYIGDYKKGSVGVYSNSGNFLYYLGKGEKEFGHPNEILVDSRGFVYVSDSTNNLVKVYSQDGTFQFSFGGYGTADGQMIFPTGLAIDEYAQELYVVDHLNVRIEVFDLNGNFKRKFTSSYLLRPQGIAVLNGKVYVVDDYHSSVKIFDTVGTYIASIGIYGSGAGEFKNPKDVVISNGKMYVTNSENLRVEVFNLNEPNIVISPTSLTYTTYENSNPLSQNIQINTDITGTAQWTAIVEAPFPVTLNAGSGITPSNVSVSVDTTGMAIGTYSGKVYFYANGTEHVVNINLTIKEIPRLMVNPSNIVLHYVKGSSLPTSVLNITTTSDSVSWTAQADSTWLRLSSLSGATPSSVMVTVDSSVSSYASGTYSGNITISAPNTKNSPVTIPVTLQVVTGGSISVKTNLNEATFDITGPQNYTGSGTDWSVLDVTPGTYNITFGDVAGYKTPTPRTFTVTAGNNATIEAQYELERVANTIIAGKGGDSKNDATVRLLDLNGNILGEFKALATSYGANVAFADIDGDLSDEIIAGSGPSQGNQAVISILKPNGASLATRAIANTVYGARITTGDIDGDGIPEIAVSMITKVRNRNTNMVDIYGYSNGSLVRKAGAYASSAQGNSNAPLTLALGDVNGDGKAELVVFDSGYLKVFGFNTNLTTYLISSKAVTYASGTKQIGIKAATITIGDINGDGRSDIIIGYVNDVGDSIIKAYKADLTETSLNFTAFAGGKVAPSLSAMDADGDGIVEILAGKGPASTNDATLRIFGSSGNMLKEIKAFNTLYGVNAALGFIKR